jgi:hypothetical protein
MTQTIEEARYIKERGERKERKNDQPYFIGKLGIHYLTVQR